MPHAPDRRVLLLAACAALAAGAAPAAGPSAAALDASVDAALERMFAAIPDSRDLAARAAGALVFPQVVKGGLIIGGQYGEGALRVGGVTKGYYRTVAASYGLQIGGQTFGYAMFFMNDAALRYLDASDGWDVGTAPTLVYGEEGWSGALNASHAQNVLVVFFGQKGAMAGLGVQGTKITAFDPDG